MGRALIDRSSNAFSSLRARGSLRDFLWMNGQLLSTEMLSFSFPKRHALAYRLELGSPYCWAMQPWVMEKW